MAWQTNKFIMAIVCWSGACALFILFVTADSWGILRDILKNLIIISFFSIFLFYLLRVMIKDETGG